MSEAFSGYDIIGDVHGCFDELVELLELLGYRNKGGVYRHPDRQVVFLGDLVDRGPKIRETLHLVQAMVDRGSARMVLGNHEINVLGFHTRADPDSGRSYLRERTLRHRLQIAQTLEQFQDYPGELEQFLAWFQTLPLFLEFEHFRVAHACWDQAMIDKFMTNYSTQVLTPEILARTSDYKNLEFRVVSRLTQGTIMLLPDNEVIVSNDGVSRRYFRTKFWLTDPRTYGDVVFQPDALPEHLHNRQLSDEDRGKLLSYRESEKPLFVGHYWRSGEPQLVQKNIACLDYSAVYGGKLMAYRMHRPGYLDAGNFVWVDLQGK